MRVYLKGRCPICGRRMYVYQYGYRCESCGFKVKAFICNRYISQEDAEAILYKNDVILDGFSQKDGKVFSSIPVIDGESVVLDNTICRCPFNGGRIYVDSKWFKCDKRDKCQHPCFFKHSNVRRCYDGHLLSVDEVRNLIEKKTLEFEVRDIEGNPQNRILSLQARQIKFI